MKNVPCIEPIPMPDIFVTGFASIEAAGGDCVRFVLCCEQNSLYGGGLECVVVSRLIIPSTRVLPMVRQVTGFTRKLVFSAH